MSILFAILLFSILIFVHELGHFVAAKLSGVQVNEFAMFMGPALWKKQVGETLYAIRLIPIGGYCAMEGEDGGSDNPRSFDRASWWKRLIILFAGAAMNFIVGVALMLVVYLPVQQVVVPVIDSFEWYSTVGGTRGLQEGDRILEVDGEKIYVQSDFSLILDLNPSKHHDLLVERKGNKVFLDNFLNLISSFNSKHQIHSPKISLSIASAAAFPAPMAKITVAAPVTASPPA
jgi:regulator of sigma E protease